ncbi:ATPase synthesis protein 25 mitochondrial [Staphylotrichum longicolle]|uniref:ATPase synthesis protein 25 n=1 Tax=Staphylotrichum longicolle TaxID=669026 RepID=A0AAD4ETS1_9PEZI|nr:ATPase synthesis protein 25 mitochondrial [Staphylotrichum longicolle]
MSVANPKSSRLAPSTTAAAFSTFRPTPRRLKSPAIVERAEQQHDKGLKDDKGDAASATEASGSDVPWYLQVEAPRHPTLLHEPAPLPEIPDESPKLMEPLLKYVADELGLDELSLLDLREMEPPPALGPNLLMVFGTARSERHLHVSADRLVRWLRGRGITATADGLLGRNELKTKLRRIARKAKLLGNAGVPRGGDDGISTGRTAGEGRQSSSSNRPQFGAAEQLILMVLAALDATARGVLQCGAKERFKRWV